MSAILYPWTRIWVPIDSSAAEATPYSLDFRGFFINSRHSYVNTNSVGKPLTDWQTTSCLVLLGEPGMGKSSEWRRQLAETGKVAQHLFLDLKDFGSESSLRDAILESTALQQAQETNTTFYLWLDSLDEGLLHVRTLTAELLRIFNRPNFPRTRFQLRILCRNVGWPAGLTDDLAQLFPGQHAAIRVQPLLLAPLSFEQVAEAARQEKLDYEAFLAAVAKANAVPLALRPVTLKLLLNLFRHHGPNFGSAGSPRRSDLYEQGCRELCAQPDARRSVKAPYDTKERLLLAAHLAMLMVIGNRRVVRLEPDAGDLLPTELGLHDVGQGNTAQWSGLAVPLHEDRIRDVLANTALFVPAGPGRVAWAHPYYAEFLAAWYLHQAQVPVAQLRPLFRSAADPTGGVVPGLQVTAAWLAALNPAFFDELLQLDPVALLQSDLGATSSSQREKVTVRLFDWCRGLSIFPQGIEPHLPQLAYPGLEQQLLPVLSNVSASRTECELAYELAEACAVGAVEPELVRQCLDAAFPFRRRLTALGVLAKIGSPSSLQQLRVLVKSIPVEDKNDEFRGKLLAMLWPDYLSGDEMFSLLVPSQNRGFSGNYKSFLTIPGLPGTLEYGLRPENLPSALRWLEQNREGWTEWGEWQDSDFREMVDKVFERAWLATDEPGVIEALAAAVAAAIDRCHDMVIPAEPSIRYAVIQEMIAKHILPEGYMLLFNNCGQPLLDVHDWEWAITQLGKATTTKLKKHLASATSRLLWNSLGQVDTPVFLSRFTQLYQLAGVENPATADASISAECAFLWTATDLDDKNVIRQRAWYLAKPANLAKAEANKQKKLKQKKRSRYLPALHRRNLHHLFDEPITNPWRQWRRLVWYLNYSSKKRQGHERLPGQVDMQKFLTRARLSKKRLAQLSELAWQVVQQQPHVPHSIYGDGYQQPGPTLGLALALCWQHSPQRVQALSGDFWKGWIDFLLALLVWSDDPQLVGLLRHASGIIPAEVLDAVMRQADAANQQLDRTYKLDRILNACPVAELPDALFARITSEVWHPEHNWVVLLALLQHPHPAARALADNIMSLPDIGPAHSNDIVLIYRWHLFEHEIGTPDDWWQWWQMLARSASLTRDVINEGMHGLRPSQIPLLAKLNEDQLRAVTHYLVQNLGLAEDTKDEDWRRETMGTRLRQFRDAVVGELASRGTPAALVALQHLQKDAPDGPWLRWRLDQARANLRRNAWQPVAPSVLVKLCRTAGSRWVQSSADLLDVVLESLERLQQRLHAETAEAIFLWQREPLNPAPGQAQIHVVHDENHVSDYIKRHLDADICRPGIIAHREVEIRASIGTGTGQRPDILIRASAPGKAGETSQESTVIIETKLSKHRHKDFALAGQLVPYLQDNPTWQGLYLVCWHFGQHDNPSKAAELPALKTMLEQQAAVASARGTSVRALVLDIRLPSDSTRNI